jgi:hypothetical protein
VNLQNARCNNKEAYFSVSVLRTVYLKMKITIRVERVIIKYFIILAICIAISLSAIVISIAYQTEKVCLLKMKNFLGNEGKLLIMLILNSVSLYKRGSFSTLIDSLFI